MVPALGWVHYSCVNQKEKTMEISFINDVLPSLLGVLVIVNGAYHAKKEEKRKLWVDVVFGIAIMAISIWNSIDNSNNIEHIKDTADSVKSSLEKSLNETRNQRISDSISNEAFQKYVKDTFGIERVGDRAQKITYSSSTTNYFQPAEIKQETPKVTDENNYTFKVEGTKLYISPKEGVWLHPFFQFDSRLLAKNKRITDESEIPIDENSLMLEEVNIENSTFRVYTVRQLKRAIIYNKPLVLDLSSDPGQFIIFGDEGSSTKIYIYQKGKVSWYPSNRP